MPTGPRPSGGVSQMRRWLAPGVGIAGGLLVTTGQPAALGSVLLLAGVLGGLLLLLISMLVVVAVFSAHRVRRGTAEKILAQLLSALTQAGQP
jgi:hypothetical protein